jgi:hypothetical protein
MNLANVLTPGSERSRRDHGAATRTASEQKTNNNNIILIKKLEINKETNLIINNLSTRNSKFTMYH